jgi:hypothetical protein
MYTVLVEDEKYIGPLENNCFREVGVRGNMILKWAINKYCMRV